MSHTLLQIVKRQCHLLFYKLSEQSVIDICTFYQFSVNGIMHCFSNCQRIVLYCSTSYQLIMLCVVQPVVKEHCHMLFYFSRE